MGENKNVFSLNVLYKVMEQLRSLSHTDILMIN